MFDRSRGERFIVVPRAYGIYGGINNKPARAKEPSLSCSVVGKRMLRSIRLFNRKQQRFRAACVCPGFAWKITTFSVICFWFLFVLVLLLTLSVLFPLLLPRINSSRLLNIFSWEHCAYNNVSLLFGRGIECEFFLLFSNVVVAAAAAVAVVDDVSFQNVEV